jgi:hypothetical protein
VFARRDRNLTEFSAREFARAKRKSNRGMARVAKGARRKIQKAFDEKARVIFDIGLA